MSSRWPPTPPTPVKDNRAELLKAIKADLRAWHELVIGKYSHDIQNELREAMTKWLASYK